MNDQSELEEIVGDKISGSSIIVKRTLDLLVKTEEKAEVIDRIVRAHPAMAGLKRIQSMLEENEAEDIRTEFLQMDEDTVSSGRELIEGKTWVTISQSHTAERILEKADRVYVLKSAPGNEGLETYDYLCLHHIDVELIEDASMGEVIKSSDGVLVGADTLLPDGFINKVGTLPLALLSEYLDKMFYVAAASYKAAEAMECQSPFEYVPSELVDRYISE